MPIGMGVASPKFSKSDRKPNKTKHCTTPIYREKYKENPRKRGTDLIRCKWQVKMSKRCIRLRLREGYSVMEGKDEK